MKKKLFLAGAAMLLAAAAVTGYSASSKSNVSELLNANVEALARGESGGETCYNTITIQEGVRTLYCGTCSYVDGAPSWVSGTSKC